MSWWTKEKAATPTKDQERIAALEKDAVALRSAFNVFFDLVAVDLGYEVAKDAFGYGDVYTKTSDPRRPAEIVTPEKREIVRNDTARCKAKR